MIKRWPDLTRWKRNLLLLGAIFSFSAAFWLLAASGIPERVQYTSISLQGDELPVAPEINAIAPPFVLNELSGKQINLLTLRGKPVIINFWATWCDPCRAEMPALQMVYDKYQERSLHILAVNLGERTTAVREWQQTMGLTFDLLLDPPQAIAALYQLRGQPSTYILSPDGIITHIFYGPVAITTLETAIAPYFSN